MDRKISSDELFHILEKLVALHRNLVDLLNEEYSHMSVVDVKGLSEAAHSKEILMSEIFNLEQVRIKIVEKIATTFGLKTEDATLLSIASALNSTEGDKLRSIRVALNLLVVQAKDLNARNMDFVQSSLARLEDMKRNALGLSNTAVKENYSNSGARQPLPEQGGRLLSTEA